MHYTGFGARSQQTPQSEPIPGSAQIQNNAGGYSFAVDDMTRLHRFLILGSSSPTYYTSQRKLTKENLDAVERLLKDGKGKEVVNTIVEISEQGRAPSNDPALFALARCCAADDVETKRAAYAALPKVARIGTHLLHFVEYVKQFRGRGRLHRRAVKAWYNEKAADKLAYQAVKYQQRDGWSQRDVLRLARPKPVDTAHNSLYHWMVKGWEDVTAIPEEEALGLIWAFEKAKRTNEPNEIADLIIKYRLPREAVPTESLKSVKVWQALLEDMPLEAMTRNLATMTKNGVLVPMGGMTAKVIGRLRSQEAIQKARLHPIKILAALMTYQSGKSVRGDASWTPIPQIVDALSDAFYLSFACIEPTNKRILIAVDVSGSMHGTLVNGIPGMQCHTAAGVLAMVIARSEQTYYVMAFDTRAHPLTISPHQRLDDVVRTIASAGGGGTDCAVPFAYAFQNGLDVDAFITLSDSETWFGNRMPTQTLQAYRQKVGHRVRAINVQMASTHVTNNDPNDGDALEAVGFDVNVPQIMSEFIKGNM